MARSRELRVVITGDTKGLDRALTRAGTASGELTKHTGKLHRGLKDIGHGAAYALGAGGFGGGMYALFDITKKSIGAYKQNAEQARQTAAAIKSTGGAAHVTEKHVEKLAWAFARKTGIEKSAVQASENMLLSFPKIRNEVGKNNKIFDQATVAVGDIATRMNHGATPSIERLNKTSIQLGKALEDPVKGLTSLHRVGITFTDGQKAQIKTLVAHGRTLEAQKLILKKVREEFGGSAKAAATNSKKMHVALDELSVTIGKKLNPFLQKAAGRINKFVLQMLDGKGAGGRFAKQMQSIGKSVFAIVKPIGQAVAAIGRFGAHHPAIAKTAIAIGLAALAVKKFHVVGAVKGIASLVGWLRRLGKTKAGEEAASEIAGGLGGTSRKSAGPLRRFGSYLKRVLKRSGGSAGASGGGQLAFDLAGGAVGGTRKRAAKIRDGLESIFKKIGGAVGIGAAESAAGGLAGEGKAVGIIGRFARRVGGMRGAMLALGGTLGGFVGVGIATTALQTFIRRFEGGAKKYEPGGNQPGQKGIGGKLNDVRRGLFNFGKKLNPLSLFGGAQGGMVTPAGIVRGFATGGVAGLDRRDTVPAMLRPGEGVLTPEAVRSIGGPGTITVLNSAASNKAAKPSKRAAPLNLAAPMDDERKDLDKVLAKVTKSFQTIPVQGKKQSQLTAKNVSDHLVRGGKSWVRTVDKAGSGVVSQLSGMRAGGGREARKLRVGVGSHFDVMRKYTAGVARGMASSVVSTASGMRKHTGDQAHILRVGVGNHFEGLRKTVQVKMRAVADHTQNGIQAARKYATVGAKGVRNTVAGSYSSMDTAVFRGIGYVSSATSSALKGLGGKGLSFGVSRPKKLAVGGFLQGAGRHDTEMIMAAPGEAILNRHQQPIVESALANTYGIGLNDVFDRIRTPHYMAKGGKVKKYARGGLHPGIARAVSSVLGHFPGLQVTSTTGGGHAAGSYHYKGEAADISGSSGLMFAAANWIKHTMGRNLTEGIHNPNLSIKFGKRVSPGFWGATTWGRHRNHIHLAVAGMLGALGGIGGGGGTTQLKTPKVSGRGPLAEIARRALGKVTGAANSKISSVSASLADMGGGGIGGAGSATARRWVIAGLRLAGVPATPGNVAKVLGRAKQESGWNPRAVNHWDSNARAGHPSQGFLQTIPSTFNAYKVPGHGNILNPIDNTAAAVRYMLARYGHLVGPSGSGYARGGFVGRRRKFGYGGFTNRQLGLPKKATSKQAKQRFLDMRMLGLIGYARPGVNRNAPQYRGPGGYELLQHDLAAENRGPLQILTGKGGPVGNQIHAQLIAGQDALTIADADLHPNDANSIRAATTIADVDRSRVGYWRGRVAHFKKILRNRHLSPYARQGAKRELRHALDMLGSSTSDATSAIEDVQSRKDAGADTTQADVVAALNEVRDAVKAQNKTLASVDGVTVKTATKLLTDMLVGQAGYRTTQRMRTPNAGAALARY